MPLFLACQEGTTEVATVLLCVGVAMDKAERDGYTPLFMACQEGHVECTQLLSSYSASSSFSIGGQTFSAEHLATLNHHGILHVARGVSQLLLRG